MIHPFTRMGHAFVQQTILWIYLSIPMTANLTVLKIWTQHIATRVTYAENLRDLQPILFFYLVSFDKKLKNVKRQLYHFLYIIPLTMELIKLKGVCNFVSIPFVMVFGDMILVILLYKKALRFHFPVRGRC